MLLGWKAGGLGRFGLEINHCLHDAVFVVGDEVEGGFCVFEGEFVGDQRVGVQLTRCHHIQGWLGALILATHVLEANLLAAHVVYLEGDVIDLWDTDHHELTAGLEQCDGLIDGVLLTATFEDAVEACWFMFGDRLNDVVLVGIAGPVGAEVSDAVEACVELVGDVAFFGTGIAGGEEDACPDGPCAENADVCPGEIPRELRGIYADGEGFAEDALVKGSVVFEGEAAFGGHDDEFGKTPFGLAGAPEELDVAAGMCAADAALVARAAGHRGIDGDSVAGLQVGNGVADLDDGACRFMAYGKGVLDDHRADAAGGVVMNVGAADADGTNTDEDIGVVVDDGVGDFTHFHGANSGE
jgi:hypothetical protein